MCDAGCDAGPLSSIVWANFLASGWFVHCYFLSCYFFSYLKLLLSLLFLFSTCPLLLSFLLLFSCYFFSYLKLLLSFLLPFFLLLSFRAPGLWCMGSLSKRKAEKNPHFIVWSTFLMNRTRAFRLLKSLKHILIHYLCSSPSPLMLTHGCRVTHIYVITLGHHWFR